VSGCPEELDLSVFAGAFVVAEFASAVTVTSLFVVSSMGRGVSMNI